MSNTTTQAHTATAEDVTGCLTTAGLAMVCLDATKNGHPTHPLARGRSRVPDDVPFVPWSPARAEMEAGQ